MLIFSCSESDCNYHLRPRSVPRSSLPFMVEHLYFDEDQFTKQYWQDDIDSTQQPGLEIPKPFAAMKNLYLSKNVFVVYCDHLSFPQRGKSDRGITHSGNSIFVLKRFGHQASGPVQDSRKPLEGCRRRTTLRSSYNCLLTFS